jgi:hypothetical protein
MLQTTCATILLPVLLAEKEHSEQPNVIHRKREVQIRVTCGKFPLRLKSSSVDDTCRHMYNLSVFAVLAMRILWPGDVFGVWSQLE